MDQAWASPCSAYEYVATIMIKKGLSKIKLSLIRSSILLSLPALMIGVFFETLK